MLAEPPLGVCEKEENAGDEGQEAMEGPGHICGFTELCAKPYSWYQPAQDTVFLFPLSFFWDKWTYGKPMY